MGRSDVVSSSFRATSADLTTHVTTAARLVLILWEPRLPPDLSALQERPRSIRSDAHRETDQETRPSGNGAAETDSDLLPALCLLMSDFVHVW